MWISSGLLCGAAENLFLLFRFTWTWWFTNPPKKHIYSWSRDTSTCFLIFLLHFVFIHLQRWHFTVFACRSSWHFLFAMLKREDSVFFRVLSCHVIQHEQQYENMCLSGFMCLRRCPVCLYPPQCQVDEGAWNPVCNIQHRSCVTGLLAFYKRSKLF